MLLYWNQNQATGIQNTFDIIVASDWYVVLLHSCNN